VQRISRVSSATIVAVLACIAGVMQMYGAGSASAFVSRSLALKEEAKLHLTSKTGFTLNEQGVVVGTVKGTIYIHLRLTSNSSVVSEVNIYPPGGSLSGLGSASYHVDGGFAVFVGGLAVTRGTGSYAHAHGSDLRFTGTIQRRGDAVAVQLSGLLTV